MNKTEQNKATMSRMWMKMSSRSAALAAIIAVFLLTFLNVFIFFIILWNINVCWLHKIGAPQFCVVRQVCICPGELSAAFCRFSTPSWNHLAVTLCWTTHKARRFAKAAPATYGFSPSGWAFRRLLFSPLCSLSVRIWPATQHACLSLLVEASLSLLVRNRKQLCQHSHLQVCGLNVFFFLSFQRDEIWYLLHSIWP